MAIYTITDSNKFLALFGEDLDNSSAYTTEVLISVENGYFKTLFDLSGLLVQRSLKMKEKESDENDYVQGVTTLEHINHLFHHLDEKITLTLIIGNNNDVIFCNQSASAELQLDSKSHLLMSEFRKNSDWHKKNKIFESIGVDSKKIGFEINPNKFAPLLPLEAPVKLQVVNDSLAIASATTDYISVVEGILIEDFTLMSKVNGKEYSSDLAFNLFYGEIKHSALEYLWKFDENFLGNDGIPYCIVGEKHLVFFFTDCENDSQILALPYEEAVSKPDEYLIRHNMSPLAVIKKDLVDVLDQPGSPIIASIEAIAGIGIKINEQLMPDPKIWFNKKVLVDSEDVIEVLANIKNDKLLFLYLPDHENDPIKISAGSCTYCFTVVLKSLRFDLKEIDGKAVALLLKHEKKISYWQRLEKYWRLSFIQQSHEEVLDAVFDLCQKAQMLTGLQQQALDLFGDIGIEEIEFNKKILSQVSEFLELKEELSSTQVISIASLTTNDPEEQKLINEKLITLQVSFDAAIAKSENLLVGKPYYYQLTFK